MLLNLIAKFMLIVEPVTEQQKLDKFITEQNPTSVADVEHWMKVYDQRQYKERSSGFLNYTL